MESGISTLGITFGYGMETTAGVKPTVFTQLHRINSIGGITIESEQIEGAVHWNAKTAFSFTPSSILT